MTTKTVGTCEGCGTIAACTQIRLTNGGLRLCRQCLDEFNAKSPALAVAQEERNAALQRAEKLQADIDSMVYVSSERHHGASGMCCQLRERERQRAERAEGERDAYALAVKEAWEEVERLKRENAELRTALETTAKYLCDSVCVRFMNQPAYHCKGCTDARAALAREATDKKEGGRLCGS